jgi:hypothetical protein
MKISIRIAHETGWSTFIGNVPDGSDEECYRLPKVEGEAASRAEFWSAQTGLNIPEGRGLIWEVV